MLLETRMLKSFLMRLNLFLIAIIWGQLIFGQQIESPLTASFETYLTLRKQSEFNLEWESLGPVINSARVEAVQLDPTHPGTMYVAFGSGNLWKTIDNGLTWKTIFEDQPSLGIGDIALAPSDPNIIYLGTGESLKKARNFTMPGNGVYKSMDGGETWRHLGLDDTWHIGEIVVHPKDPNIVAVAALGHFWSTNANRGVYITKDGGETWNKTLYVNENIGATDIVFSNSDPNIIYASMWENNPGITGEGSCIYRSNDGGNSWKKVVNGFPQNKDVGRIGLAVSYSNPLKVYALVDNKGEKANAEIYRTIDGGENWKRTHEADLEIFSVVGWYFTDIYVNPQNDEEIYGLGVRMAHSADGGKSFDLVGGDVFHFFPSDADRLHLDHCELWINPLNPNHLALGNDGGLYVSYNKGGNWMHYNNIPAGEFYDITIDRKVPYTIYGGTQDDATVFGPSKEWDPRYADDWKYLWVDSWSGGDGCVTQVDPQDANTVYFSSQNGGIRRKDVLQDTSIGIQPKFPKGSEKKLEYNFVAPYTLSKFDNRTLYHAGNYVFKSIDRGDSWKLISEDLSNSKFNNKKSVAAGAFAESPLEPGKLFLGTDKGAFWFTKNDGQTWEERSENLPDHYLRSIYPSKYNPNRVYITLSGINYDDLSNYIYVSENNGLDWKKIQGNLPNEVAYVIYEDPEFENILYVGMYRGVYISIDRGQTWSILGKNMPASAIADLELEPNTKDLIAASHGRGIYKMNLKPLHDAMKQGFPSNSDLLFEIPPTNQPWINDTHRDPDYNTIKKAPITFWSSKKQLIELLIYNDKNEKIWSKKWNVERGFNQLRWNLILESTTSPLPYYIHYDKFIKEGTYKFQVQTENAVHEKELNILPGIKR